MKRLLMIMVCAAGVVALNAQQSSGLQGTSDVSKSKKTEIKESKRTVLQKGQTKAGELQQQSLQQLSRQLLSEKSKTNEPSESSVTGTTYIRRTESTKNLDGEPKEESLKKIKKEELPLREQKTVSGKTEPQVEVQKVEPSAMERLPEWQNLTPIQQNKLRELQQIDPATAQKEMIYLLHKSGAVEQAKAVEISLKEGELKKELPEGKLLEKEGKEKLTDAELLKIKGKQPSERKKSAEKNPLVGVKSLTDISGQQIRTSNLHTIDIMRGSNQEPVDRSLFFSEDGKKITPLPLNSNAPRAVLLQTAERIQEEPQDGPQFAPPAGDDGPSYAPGDRSLREGFERSGNNLPAGWQQTAFTGSAQWEITEDIGASAGWPIPAYVGTRYAGINGLNNTPGFPTDAWLYSRGINLTGGKQYTIRFYAYMFGYEGPENVDLYIGTAQIPEEMDTHLWNSVTAGKTKNIYDYSYGGDDDVWEEFTVTFTPLYTGIYYLGFYDNTTYWNALFAGIDNIYVTEMAYNDLSIIPIASFYAQVPKSQVTVTANVRNVGIEEQTNIVFSAALNGSSAFGSAPVIPSLAAGVRSDNQTIIASTDPPGFINGVNTVYYTVTADQSEEAPDDNTASATFTGNDVIYAYDNTTSFTEGLGLNVVGSLGNIFPVYNEAVLSAVYIGFTNDASLDYSISLYKMTGDLTYASADLLGAVPATRNQTGLMLVPVTPVTLEAGARYFLCVNQLTSSNVAVAYDANASRVVYYFTQNNGVLTTVTGFGGLAVRMVLQAETCSLGTPDNLSVIPGRTSATFSWDYPDDVFGYRLILNDGTTDYVYFSENKSIAIFNIASVTNYTWTVQALCDLQQGGIPVAGAAFTTLDCVLSLPWSENFDGGRFLPECWTTATPIGTAGWTSMTLSSYVHSTPLSAIRIDEYGDQDDWLISPPIAMPATQGYELSFWSYNLYPLYYGQNSVRISTTGTDPGDFTDEIWAPTSVSASWVETKLHLGAYAGDTIHIAFRYQGDYAHAWALDDIAITQIIGEDVALISITEPSGVVHTATDAVTVVLKNNGAGVLNSIPIAFEVDGVLISAETITVSGGLSSGSTYSYTFNTTADLSVLGTHTVRAYVALSNDTDPTNDTLIKSILTCDPLSVPLFEGFENGIPVCWIQEQVSGTTTWRVENSFIYTPFVPHSGNSYALLQREDYGGVSRLIIPQLDLSVGDYILRFWHAQGSWWGDQDILRVYYKTSATGTWTLLQAYTGDIQTWTEREIRLPNGSSDYYIAFEGTLGFGYGIALDDVAIEEILDSDAALIDILQPSGTDHTTPENVVVSIQNQGLQDITGLQVAYELNGVLQTTESVSGILTSGATTTHTFSVQVDLTGRGIYTIRAYVILPGDQNPANDTFNKQVVNCDGMVFPTPFYEGFEESAFPPSCWTKEPVGAATATWTAVSSNGTLGNPPVAPHSGSLFAIFQNERTTADVEKLITPPIDLSTGIFTLKFWHTQADWLGDQDILRVYYKTSATGTWTLLEEYINSISTWQEEEITLPDGSANYYIAFEGTARYGYGIALDDVSITQVQDNDAELLSIDQPAGVVSTLTTVSVTIKNAGTQPITSLPLGFDVDGVTQVSETYTGALASGSTTTYTFTAPATLTSGAHTIRVYTALPGDENLANDTLERQLQVCNITIPLYEGFENGIPPCWIQEPVGSTTARWNVVNTNTYPAAPHGGSSYTLLRVNSSTSNVVRLTIPSMDLSVGTFVLKFWHTQAAWSGDQDELRIYYKTSATGTWTLLEEYINSISTWQEEEITLPNGSSDYYIAFEGTTNYGYGIALDDVSITQVQDNDAELLSIDQPAGVASALTTVSVTIKNAGTQPITSLPLGFDVDGVTQVSETYTGALASGSTTTYTFTAPATLTSGATQTIRAYTGLSNDQNRLNDTVTKDVFVCGSITVFPHTEGFEYLPYTTATSYTPPQCWSSTMAGTNTANRPGRSTTTPHAGSYSWLFSSMNRNYDSSGREVYDQYLISPELGNTGVNKTVSFYYRFYSVYGAPDEKIRVGYSTTGNDIDDDFTWGEDIVAAGSTVWQEYQVTIQANVKYIAIHYTATYDYYVFIDDITISEVKDNDAELLSIDQPAGVASTLTTVSVTIKNAGTQPITSLPLGFDVDGVTQVSETYTGALASGSTTTYTFTAPATLTSGAHTIRVYTALPGDENLANDTLERQLQVCNITIPFYEGFEGSNFPPDCWSTFALVGTALWEAYSGIPAAYDGQNSALRIFEYNSQDDWLVTPPIAIPATGSCELHFWSQVVYAEDYVKNSILISTTTIDPGSFVEIWSPERVSESMWEEVLVELSAYAGQTIYIAFRYEGSYAHAWLIDEVEIREMTHDIGVTNITANANLGHAEPVAVTIHNYGEAVTATIPLTLTVNCATYTVNVDLLSLAPYTDTTIYINVDMALPITYDLEASIDYADNNSVNNRLTATVTCPVYNVARIWDFNDGQMPADFTLLTLDNGSPYYNGNFPNNEAWVTFDINVLQDPQYAAQQYVAMSTSYFNLSGQANRWMITPKINLERNMTLSWKAWALDASYRDGYTVKLSTTGINPSDFTVTLFTTAAENTAITEHKVDLSSYTGENVYIAFIEDSYDQYLLFVDDITLTPGAAICSGEEFNYVPAILEGSTVSWTRAAIAGINGGVAATGTGPINETLTNTTSQPIMVTYEIIFNVAGCDVYTSSTQVRVSPKPLLTSALTLPAVCSDFVVSYEYETSIPDVWVTWERLPVTGIVDANGQTSNSGVGDVYEVLTNTLNVPVTVTYRYTLNAFGCVNIQDVQIVITPRPTKPNVWKVNGSLSFCAGDSVTLQAEAINADKYRWLIDETETGKTEGQYTTPATLTPGTHSITVTAFSAGECTSDTTTITVTVYAVPATPTLTPAGELVFCEGTAGSVTLTAGTVTGAVAYEWYKNGSWLEGVTGTSYFTSEPGTYTVRVLNAIGCASPLAVPVTVVTLPLPTTPIVTLSGTLEFCEGESALLQTNALNAATYTWYNGATTLPETSALLEVTASGSYTVEVVSSDNCPVPPLRSEAIVITVNPKPGQPVITPPNAICEGESYTLQVTQATQVAGATYRWYQDGVQVQDDAPVTFTVTKAGFYQVETVSDKGCVSPISLPVELVVNAVPSTPVITGDEIACAGEPILLSAESDGGVTYIWYKNNNTEIQNGISQTYSVDTRFTTTNTTDTYTVRTVSAAGCSSTLSAGKQVEIEIYPAAPVIDGDPLVRKTRGSSHTFEVVTPNSALQYQWYHAPKPTPQHRAAEPVELWDGQGPLLFRTNIQLSDAGEYYVIAITPKAGCFTKSAPVELMVEDDIMVTNIVSSNGDGQNDRWLIEGLETYKSHEIHLVNRYGNEVYHTSNYPMSRAEQERIGWDGSNLPDGVYFYSIYLTDADDTLIKRTGYVTLKH